MGRAMKFKRIRLFALALSVVFLVLNTFAADDVKYVFLLIGDGYGQAQRHVTETLTGKKLAMSQMDQTLVTGHDNVFGKTTDSAASGTAIACGVKTYNSAIGLDKDKQPVESLAMKLQRKGFKIGLVSSSPLTDATPAAHYAHQLSRKMHKEIGLDMAKSGFQFIGGAGVHDKTTFDDLKAAGWEVLSGPEALSKARPGVQTFVNCNPFTPWNDGDVSESPTLAEYLRKVIELLDGPQGFFIMLENGHTDYAGHSNDAGKVWREVLALDEAVKVALAFQKERPNETIVIVTSDHETGGLEAPNPNRKKLQVLRKQKAPKADPLWSSVIPVTNDPDVNVKSVTKQQIKILQDALGISFTKNERDFLSKGIEKALKEKKPRSAFTKNMIGKVFSMRDERAGVKYTTGGHTSTPVFTDVQGPGTKIFEGPLENSDIPHLLQAILLPDLQDTEYINKRAKLLAHERTLKPYRALPEAAPDVLSLDLLSVETRTSFQAGKKLEVQLPGWEKYSAATCRAKDGDYYLEIKNDHKSLPLLAGVAIGGAPADTRLLIYDPANAVMFVKDDGSEEWTPKELAEKFRMICPPQGQIERLYTSTLRPELAQTKCKASDAIVEYDAAQKKVSFIEVMQASKAPVIDGVPDDKVWAEAKENVFVDIAGGTIENAPTAKVLVDKDHAVLYLALSVADTNLVSKSVERDTEQYFDDCFEIFIGEDTTDRYYQIIINPIGSIYDAEKYDNRWNADVEVKTHSDKSTWSAELALPLKQFEIDGLFVANICHTDKPASKQSNLSPTGGDFHKKINFIPLIFAEHPEVTD